MLPQAEHSHTNGDKAPLGRQPRALRPFFSCTARKHLSSSTDGSGVEVALLTTDCTFREKNKNCVKLRRLRILFRHAKLAHLHRNTRLRLPSPNSSDTMSAALDAPISAMTLRVNCFGRGEEGKNGI